jgi:hypothetical protein
MLYCKCGLFFSETDVTAVLLGSIDPNLADENYLTWERVVESVNKNKTSLVDYKIKAVPNSASDTPNKTVSYADIKSVKISKAKDTGNDPIDDQYLIDLFTGIFSDSPYFIPASALDEAVALIKKTTLASKLAIALDDAKKEA